MSAHPLHTQMHKQVKKKKKGIIATIIFYTLLLWWEYLTHFVSMKQKIIKPARVKNVFNQNFTIEAIEVFGAMSVVEAESLGQKI